MVIGASQEEGLIDVITGSQGDVDMLLYCKNPDIKDPEVNAISPQDHIHMQGSQVFKFATRIMPKTIKKLLDKHDMTTEDIDCIVAHQANARIIEKSARDLNIDMSKMYMNISEYGNTSAASVPIAIDEAVRSGFLKRGDKFVTVAFGGGLTWGGALIRY
jgi:3-oxoacyl-[acyl-carrier-protein] synthase-3